MALTFSVAVVLSITAVCGAFLMLDVVIPNWFVIVARWIPAIVAVTVIVAYHQREVLGWFRLRTPWRSAIFGSLVAVGVCWAPTLSRQPSRLLLELASPIRPASTCAHSRSLLRRHCCSR